MNQEEKSAAARLRILQAAQAAFAQDGYDGTSLSAMCRDYGISKGILYHHFKDKDDLYLCCVSNCFQMLAADLVSVRRAPTEPETRITAYFNARTQYFAEHPAHLGLFLQTLFGQPSHLAEQLASIRKLLDQVNIDILTDLLSSVPLREGLIVSEVVDDIRMYMDYFNLRAWVNSSQFASLEETFRAHEQACRRQIHMLLYGALQIQPEVEK